MSLTVKGDIHGEIVMATKALEPVNRLNGHAESNGKPQLPPVQRVSVKSPNFRKAKFTIIGTSPLVQNKFSVKMMQAMIEKQESGEQKGAKAKKGKKDFDNLWKEACHVLPDGSFGFPASGLRAAMIDVCRMTDIKMTYAKMSVFVVQDGFDKECRTPLVRIKKGKPSRMNSVVRNATGVVDVRPRPAWDEGWEADVTLEWDADQFSLEDVTNLLMRAGHQVGIGEGRPFSKDSAGMGWGTFALKQEPSGK
jgi:hypothetical protein